MASFDRLPASQVGMTSSECLQETGAPWPKDKNLTVVVTSGSGGTGFIALQLAKVSDL
jgi:NADPH:quinone reductase-like Zn-dependent oxidoreductase